MPVDRKKNPFGSETPEWQLWENAASADALVRSYQADADRALLRASEARIKGDRFWFALETLVAATTAAE